MRPPLLDIRDLSVLIPTRHGSVAALSHVSLTLERGEVLGVVGESGAGKTMIARAISALVPAQASVSGQLLFNGRDVLTMSGAELQEHRGAGAALCFQIPRRALSPFRRIGDQIADRLEAHAKEASGVSSPRLSAGVGRDSPARSASARLPS